MASIQSTRAPARCDPEIGTQPATKKLPADLADSKRWKYNDLLVGENLLLEAGMIVLLDGITKP